MKDGTMLIHKDLVGTDNIKIPQVDTSYGAGFGDTITDSDRAFASGREPIAHFLTYGVAGDITEKWFSIDDPDTEESDPALDRTTQTVLAKIKFKQRLTEAIESERVYGKSLLVGGFSDAKDVASFSKPLRSKAELLQLAVYPGTVDEQKTKPWEVYEKDEDKNSNRYGEPVLYKLHRDKDFLIIHYSRVCEVQTRSNAKSVLDPVWDDIVCGRNIRWGASQWMYRTGGGFPVVGFPAGTTATQLEAYHNSGAFTNLMSRTGIFLAQNSQVENDGMTFEFKGAAGAALDPVPFFKSNIEQIAVATGIPQAKLVGAQAGAVTGSEVNMQDYFKVISREQAKLEDVVRWVLDKLADSGQIRMIKSAVDKSQPNYHINLLKRAVKRLIRGDYRHRTADNYEINWNSAFELSEKDEASIEETRTRSNVNKLKYMSKDEVRAEEGLDPLPDGAGEWKDASEFGDGEEFLVKSKVGLKQNVKPKGSPEDSPDSEGSD